MSGAFVERRSPFLFALALGPMICSGFIYGVGLYGDRLKTFFGMSQVESSLLANAIDVFGNYGAMCFTGLLIPYIGVTISYTVSMILIGLGYLGMYFLYTESITYSYPLIFITGLFIGIGSSTSFLCTLTTGISHTTEKIRAAAVGILLGTFGVSTFLFSKILKYALNDDLKHLFLMMFFLGTSFNFLAILFLRPPSVAESEDVIQVTDAPPQPSSNYEIAASIASSLRLRQFPARQNSSSHLIQSDAGANYSRRSSEYAFPSNLPSTPFRVSGGHSLLDMQNTALNGNTTVLSISNNDHLYASVNTESPGRMDEETIEGSHKSESISLISCVLSTRFIPIVLVAFACTSVSLTVVSNPGSMIKSFFLSRLDESEDTIDLRNDIESKNNSAVGFLALGNTLGRFVFGFLVDFTGSNFNIGRGFWLLTIPVMMTLGGLGIIFASSYIFLVTMEVLTLFAHGALFTILGTFLSERFPFHFYPSLFGFAMLGPAVGGSVGNGLFGKLFDERSVPDPLNGNATICNIRSCYVFPFEILTIFVVVIGLPLGCFVFWRDYRDRSKEQKRIADELLMMEKNCNGDTNKMSPAHEDLTLHKRQSHAPLH